MSHGVVWCGAEWPGLIPLYLLPCLMGPQVHQDGAATSLGLDEGGAVGRQAMQRAVHPQLGGLEADLDLGGKCGPTSRAQGCTSSTRGSESWDLILTQGNSVLWMLILTWGENCPVFQGR